MCVDVYIGMSMNMYAHVDVDVWFVDVDTIVYGDINDDVNVDVDVDMYGDV